MGRLVGGDVIATKDRQNISVPHTDTPNTTSASEVRPQGHTAGSAHGKVAQRLEEEREDSDGGRKEEQMMAEILMGEKCEKIGTRNGVKEQWGISCQNVVIRRQQKLMNLSLQWSK